MARYTLTEFIHGLRFADLPDAAITQARRCLIDLIGTAAGGCTTETSRIARNHAVRHFGAGSGIGARLLFDGRRASPIGAALAGGLTIDSLDCHDGHVLTKGHAGVAVLPALLAYIDGGIAPAERRRAAPRRSPPGGRRRAAPLRGEPIDGREFLTCFVLGYEIATRAGI